MEICIVGDAFDGGLSALLKHFGGVDADEKPIEQPIEKPAQAVNLQKRINLEKKMQKQAPQILSLTKKATVSLKKVGLENHTAKVALCLDISASMSSLYSSGKIQSFAERILALGCKFDDDGSIDIFLFGAKAHEAGEFSIDNYNGYIRSLINRYPLGGATYYGKAMKAVREYYFPNSITRKITKAN